MLVGDILAIESRASKASKGPWKSFIEGRDHWGGSNFIRTAEHQDSANAAIEFSGATDSDQDFIASAREETFFA